MSRNKLVLSCPCHSTQFDCFHILKSCMRETLILLTSADSSTNTSPPQQIACVTCHMSHVIYLVSPVICQLSTTSTARAPYHPQVIGSLTRSFQPPWFWLPMEGTNRQHTNIAAYRLNRPKGRLSEKPNNNLIEDMSFFYKQACCAGCRRRPSPIQLH